jgi:hypothetical protein
MWSMKVAILTAGSLWLVGLTDQSFGHSLRLGPDGVEVRPAPEGLPPRRPPPRVRDELRDRMFECGKLARTAIRAPAFGLE